MKKRAITIFLLIILATSVLGVFGAHPENARANAHEGQVEANPPPNTPVPATSPVGGGVTGFVGNVLGLPAFTLINAVLWALKGIMTVALTVSGYFLDLMLTATTELNPAQIPAVQMGWRIGRDAANSVFILIVLWIAFTIIFSLEQFGGPKLLVRVLVIALMINFSLALVSAAFGVTNQLARVFSDNLPRNAQTGALEVSAFVVNAIDIASLDKALDYNSAQNTAQRLEQQERRVREYAASANPDRFIPGPQKTGFNATKDTFLASLGVRQTKAGTGQDIYRYGLVGCGLGFFIPIPGVGCLAGAGVGITAALVKSLFGASGDEETLYATALKLAISVVILTAAAGMLFFGAIALLSRLIAMVFLSISAPLALLAWVVPGNIVKKYWDQWSRTLVDRAIFAPIFFFLLYISLFMLDQYHTAAIAVQKQYGVTAVASADALVGILIAAGLMWFTVSFARKAGGAVADVAMSWTKIAGGFALGAVTGGVGAVGAAGLATRLRPGGFAEKAVTGIAQLPIPGARAPLEAASRFLTGRKKQVEDREKELGTLSKDQTLAAYRGAITPTERAALALRIAKEGWIKDLETSRPGSAAQIFNVASRFGFEETVLKARPDLATPERVKGFAERLGKENEKRRENNQAELTAQEQRQLAQRMAVENIKPTEAPNVAIKPDDITQDLAQTMWSAYHPEHIRRIAQDNPAMMTKLHEKLLEELERNADFIDNVSIDTYRFLTSTAARALGLSLPDDHKKPKAALKEEIGELGQEIAKLDERLDELGAEAAAMDRGNQRQEADKIRNQEIPKTRTRKTRLEAKRTRIGDELNPRPGAQEQQPQGGQQNNPAPNP